MTHGHDDQTARPRRRLRYLAVRLSARVLPWLRTGPGPRYPESLTAELSQGDEDWLAGLDRELWPRQGRPGRLGADYTLRHGPEEDQQ